MNAIFKLILLVSAISTAGCAAWQEAPKAEPIAFIYIASPKFCSRTVHTYSDFAYIRPSQETVIGNTTCDLNDGMDDDPVVWWSNNASLRWEPSPEQSRAIAFSQSFNKGRKALPKHPDALAALLDVAKSNKVKDIRLTPGYGTGKHENPSVAMQRAREVRKWLVDHGIDGERIAIGDAKKGSTSVGAEIVVVIND